LCFIRTQSICNDDKKINNKKNSITLDELLTTERTQYLQTFQLGLDQHKTAKSAIKVMLQVTAGICRLEKQLEQEKLRSESFDTPINTCRERPEHLDTKRFAPAVV
jgi:hypothetical protein